MSQLYIFPAGSDENFEDFDDVGDDFGDNYSFDSTHYQNRK